MAEKNKNEKVNILSYDPVETPEEVIAKDTDVERKAAFQETYKRIAKIIPEYFMSQKKKRKNATSGGGTAFSQNIVVTPEKVEVQTNEVESKEEIKEEKERED